MVQHQIGALRTVDGQDFIRTDKGEAGFASYGRYSLYQPGSYVVTFNINTDGINSDEDNLVGWADVAAADEKMVILERTNVFADRLRRNGGRVTLPFRLKQPTRVKFRVYSSGATDLDVSTKPVVAAEKRRGYAPILAPEVSSNNRFFIDNFQKFRAIYENGIQLKIDEDEVLAGWRDISFNICTVDAIQIVNGIFFGGMYNFSLSRQVLAVDIGMNIGLTSLYMARDPRVTEVHAFEPFRAPFDRAIANFALNPVLAAKIRPVNVGLSNANETLNVLSNADGTIGRSIKGAKSGSPEQITIRDVAEVFGELIPRAKANNCEIVVKIDCEGSEFPIFESLTKTGMLKDIRAVMTEWHKKGSAERSQRGIVASLVDNDFVIFDRTNPNRDAGMLYAVRTAMTG